MNLLIVDDEYYTVESLRMKIRENCPQFDQILCAYNLNHAMEYFSRYEIAVMICDIEMPGGSGLELLEQIRSKGLSTACIFLTAYAKFDYISRAMKLSSCDYLLKPAEDEPLLAAVEKAAALYEEQKQNMENTLYAGYWKESELYMMEQFCQDLLEGTLPHHRDMIRAELEYRKLSPGWADETFILLLIQCDPSPRELSDQNIFEFALKNIAREYFYAEGELPIIVRMVQSCYILPLPAGARTQPSVASRCRSALSDFVPHFPYAFNFFVAPDVCSVDEMPGVYENLQKTARENVALENHVFDLAQPKAPALSREMEQIPLSRWTDLLLQNQLSRLLNEVLDYLEQMKASGTARRESLTRFYYSFLHLIFETTNKSPEEYEAFQKQLCVSAPEQPVNSIRDMQQWVEQALDIYQRTIARQGDHDESIHRICEHVKSHLYEDLNRDTLAAMVHLNADYLSHMFKKETGMSLTNYIIEERIRLAKQLLSRKDMSIRDIAISCGFQNISYFSRQFKKSTGITPREFRGK